MRRRLHAWPSLWGGIAWMAFVGATMLPRLISSYRTSSTPFICPDTLLFKINEIDSLSLLSLPGMTPYKVRGFLELRELMGGFWEIEELEVWDSLTWLSIAPYFRKDIKSPHSIVPSFNLNEIDSSTLVLYQICRPVSARRLVRYRKKIGRFSQWNQIDSLYGLNRLERYRLRRYGVLGPSRSYNQKSPKLLDINAASAEELERLPGIGFRTAERIVKYRSKLRYFVRVEQLREVWGLQEENYNKARPYLYVGPPQESPLSLRKASVEELASHPYISWRLARFLYQKSQSWKDMPIPSEIWQNWLPDSLRERLSPYLSGE
ncbi:MAG: helix-hairpin-helix domain-containing protein [Bacteroidia bacterium]|nr:helix-hairpin-helix domain-containing protein [Bacteroidia bacterium]MDW8134640.1 helix-hairpin-helix domain-containing protein [Bacteroidia bacterium]